MLLIGGVRLRTAFYFGLGSLAFVYLLLYGVSGPQIWQVYPFNGAPMPDHPPELRL